MNTSTTGIGRRLLSMLLAFVMVFGMLPASAFAEEHVHTYGEWTVSVEPTCTAQGQKTRTCTDCEDVETEAIPANGHSWSGWTVTAAPTCTESGSQTRSCGVCGEVETETIPANGHSWSDWTVTVDPTCTGTGERTHSCSVCGTVETETVSANGHTWGDWQITADPNCTDAGSKERVCSVCGEKETEVVPANGHSFGDWQTTVEPNCTETGSKERVCSVCGEKETELIPANGHSFGDWQITLEPNCTEAGSKERVCSVCGEKETETVDALGHDWGEWETTVEYTCDEDGEQIHTCSRCKETETEVVPAAHKWGEWEVTKEATCTKAGEKVRTCEACEKTETETIPALGHKWDVEDEDEESTCTVCGEHREAKYNIIVDGQRWRKVNEEDGNVETAEDWAAMFYSYVPTGDWAKDLLTIASTQIGYRGINLENKNGDVVNYSRYGDWYGIPFGSWCAMFVSFCLNYAQVPRTAMPVDASCENWVSTLSGSGKYASAGTYSPKPGDLIFFDYYPYDSRADHVGIVSSFNEENGLIVTIEGATNNIVKTHRYNISDKDILGFGIMPENPALIVPEPEIITEETDKVVRTDHTIYGIANGRTITVSGMLPADAELQIVPVSDEIAKSIAAAQQGTENVKVAFAFDISIISGGEKYDLEYYGDSITVSVSSISEAESVKVTHYKIDLTDESGRLDADQVNLAQTTKLESENLSTDTEDGAVFFDLSSCSYVDGLIVEDDTRSGDAKGGSDTKGEGEGEDENFSWVDEYGAPCEPEDNFKDFLEWLGDQYYTKTGIFYNKIGGDKVKVVVTGPTQSPDENGKFQAGQTLDYTVTYTFGAAESFSSKPYFGAKKLFDDYEHVTFKIKLPEGLYLGACDHHPVSTQTITENGKNYTVYTLDFASTVSATGTTNAGFGFKIFIGNNGTDLSINDYVLPADMVSLYADWTVVDKRIENDPKDVKDYSLTAIASTAAIHTTSPDKWGVEKTAYTDGGYPKIDKDSNPKTLTIKWKVNVGLLDPTDQAGERLLTSSTNYNTTGRDAVTSLTLSGLLTDSFVSTTNGDISPIGNKINISKSADSNSQNSVDIDVNADGSIGNVVIWPAASATDPNLVMDKYTVDSDGSSGPDTDVPAYTTYYITAVYEITDDMISDFNIAVNKIKSKNKVDTTAVLAKKDDQTDSAENEQEAPLFTKEPASFEIRKYLRLAGGTGNQILYTGSDPNYGTIGYAITDANGNPVTVYTRSGSSPNYKYDPVDLTENPLQPTTNTSSPKKYYVLPGTYKITETIDSNYSEYMTPDDTVNPGGVTPTQTLAIGEHGTFNLINKETVGSITVKKQDDKGNALPGAQFTLYRVVNGVQDPDPVGTKTTTGTTEATCIFTDLVYGTYRLYETGVPEGYSAATNLPMDITIADGNVNYTTPTLINAQTKATVTLNKYVGQNSTDFSTQSGSGFDKWTTTLPNVTFLLQRSKDGTNWEAAYTYGTEGSQIGEASLNNAGILSYDVPATYTDNTGTHHYFYRFRETLQDNNTYYPVNYENGDKLHGFSETKSLDEGENYTFKIFNRTLTEIRVQKEAFQYNSNGELDRISSIEVPVTLYRYTGSTTPTAESQMEKLGEKIAKYNNNNAKWSNLPWFAIVDGQETPYTYCVKETIDSSFAFSSITQSSNAIDPSNYFMIDGERYIKLDLSNPRTYYAVKFINYKKSVPVQILKQDTQGNTTIPDCEVTIYSRWQSETDNTKLDGYPMKIPNNGTGLIVYLDPDTTYFYRETKEANSHFVSATTNDNNVTIPKGGVIKTPALTPGQPVAVKQFIIVDQVHPTVTITKKTTAGVTINDAGATFAVYTKDGDTYTRVNDANGQPMVLKADGTSNGNDNRLAPGEYYFTEINVPNGYLDPNYEHSAEVYTELDTDNTYTYVSSLGAHGTTFVKGVIGTKNSDGTYSYNSTSAAFTFYNVPLTGSVTIKKRIDNVESSETGFTVYLDGTDFSTQTTNGSVTFTGVPVFNADKNNSATYGTYITYTVKEGDASTWGGTLKDKYYFVADGQEFTLIPGKTQNKDNTPEKNTLYVDNASYIKITADKLKFEGAYYGQGGLQSTMDDVTIGLYRRAAGSTGDWQIVKKDGVPVTAKTKDGGVATFTQLEREYEYALVEIATGSSIYSPWKEPTGENATFKDGFLQLLPAGTETVSDSDLHSKYNALFVSNITNSQQDYEAGEMLNASHWVRFHITKYLRAAELPEDYTINDFATSIDKSVDTKFDECVFTLYRYKLGEDEESVSYPGAKWEALGNYTSGTLYDSSLNPLPGEFVTDVDSGVQENYVYLLVEQNTGPTGAIMNPWFQYTFWHYPGRNVSITVPSPAKARNHEYKIDEDTDEDVLNCHVDEGTGGNILLGALRLSKWRDEYGTNGLPKKQYQPLPNTEFRMYFKGKSPENHDTPIAVMSTYIITNDAGKQIAFVQSGTYQLRPNGTPQNSAPSLVEYEVDGPEVAYYAADGLVIEELTAGVPSGYKVYGVPVDIYETKAPDDYGYSPMAYETYLLFVDEDPNGSGQDYRYFEDLYLVMNTEPSVSLATDQKVREWYAVESTGEEAFGNPVRRIVDYPMRNTPVEVHKVGYTPTQNTLNMDSQTIASTASVGAVPLEGVTMVLEKKGTEYTAFNYDGNHADGKFVTDADGKFFFRDGLPMGDYRIWEDSLGSSNTKYEKAYDKEKGRYRYFTVGGDGVLVYMSNPTMVDLKLTKKNLLTNQVVSPSENLSFKLGSLTATTSGSVYTFPAIPTGTYTLTETAQTASGVSSTYFAEMFAAAYPELAALVNSSMLLGYTYGDVTYTDSADADKVLGKDVIITDISPRESNTSPRIYEVTVEDPGLGKVTITKSDLSGAKLKDVDFAVYYKPFEATEVTSGSATVQLPAAAETYDATITNYNTRVTADASNPRGWQNKGFTAKTNNSGQVTVNNLAPGVYVFIERNVPEGYELLKDKDTGNILVYSAVVKGGLDIDVTVTPYDAAVDGVSGRVPTNFDVDTNGTVSVEAVNRRLAPMYAKKTAPWTLENSLKPHWKVKLAIYDSDKNGNLLATAVITDTTSQSGKGVAFKGTDNKTYYFHVGETYWLEETVETATIPYADKDHFIWTSFTIQQYNSSGTANGQPSEYTVEPDTRYPVSADTTGGITITAKNQFLYGQIDFTKWNWNMNDAISKAEFVVETLNSTTNKWETYDDATVEEITDRKGNYRAFFPLDGAEPKVYRIRETKAPFGYVLNPETGYIDVTLPYKNTPDGDWIYKKDLTGRKTEGECIRNAEGGTLTVTKYNNISSVTPQVVADKASAGFTLYHFNTTSNAWEKLEGPVYVAETDGLVAFTSTLVPGDKYAVAETNVRYNVDADSGLIAYNGLESIWVGGERKILQDIPFPTEQDPDNKIKNCYVFDYDLTAFSDKNIALKAYNIPYLKPTIAKVDVGKYPMNNVKANMEFKVFLVANGFEDKPENVDELLENYSSATTGTPRVVFSGTTNKAFEKTVGSETYYGTSILWEANDNVENRWDPTKTYVLVETKVGATNTSEYNTMVKDDPRVTWYKVIGPDNNPTQAALDENPYVLENINGFADVRVTKSVVSKTTDPENSEVVDGKVESLLEGSRKVEYILTPTVLGKNQMLTTFTLEESGLIKKDTGTDEEHPPVYDDPASIPDYEITKVRVGGATQVIPTKLTLTEDPVIKAKVTFQPSGTESNELTVPTELTEYLEVEAPSGTKSFVITYYCDQIKTATNNAYSLGEEFQAGPATVYMTVKQTPPGERGGGADGTNLAPEFTDFTNRTEAKLSYPEWSATGELAEEPTVKSYDATAMIEVKRVMLPTVSIQKYAVLEDGTENVQTGTVLQYAIKVKNTSPDNVNFVDPIVVDILPTGVTYPSNQTPDVKPLGIITNITATPKTGVATQMIKEYDDQGHETGNLVWGDAETAVIFNMTGELEPDQEITITFSAVVGESALLYETKGKEVLLTNDAYLTTAVHKPYFTERNPWGYSFKPNDNMFNPATGTSPGDTLPGVAQSLDTTTNDEASIHESGVHEALGSNKIIENDYSNYGSSNYYVYVGAEHTISVVEGQDLTLIKAVKGDRDDDFHDVEGELGVASRTKNLGTAQAVTGTVDWRLTVNNGYTASRNNLVVGDVLAKVGDDKEERDSKWNVNFSSIDIVRNGSTLLNEGADKDYVVYYYVGDSDTDIPTELALQAEMKTIRENGPTGKWTLTAPSDKALITAFIMVFDEDVVLEAGHTLMITYHTLVKEYSDPDDFFKKRAFQNANNRFYAYYPNALNSTAQSNIVGVTLMDELVRIEGDVWIDEDWDSSQKAPDGNSWPSGARRDYSGYAIIQTLANNIAFRIYDLRRAANGDSWAEDDDHGTNTNPGYGESIRHFTFTKLFPAMAANDQGIYDHGNETLVPIDHLAGTDPARYYLTSKISNAALLDIFKLTDPGAGTHYITADTTVDSSYVLSASSQHSLDSNFLESGSSGSYLTKMFYIPYATETDQSKDIGFRMYRQLEILKVAKDNNNKGIPGATFRIYGPFNEDKGTAATGTALSFIKVLDEEGNILSYKFDPFDTTTPESSKTQDLVTNDQGKILVTGLNWWKEYVLKEENAAEGYSIIGATATGTNYASEIAQVKDANGNLIDGVWTLKLPDPERTTALTQVKVENPGGIPFDFDKVGEVIDDPENPMPLEGITFTLFSDEACTTAVKDSDDNPVTATSDAFGHVHFDMLRFPYGNDPDDTEHYFSGIYYMKETDLGDNNMYWDNSTKYKLIVHPQEGTTAPYVEIQVLTSSSGTGNSSGTGGTGGTGGGNTGTDTGNTTVTTIRTGTLIEDGYTILNELKKYRISLVKIDGKDKKTPIVGAEFDLYDKDPTANSSGTTGSSTSGDKDAVKEIPVEAKAIPEMKIPIDAKAITEAKFPTDFRVAAEATRDGTETIRPILTGLKTIEGGKLDLGVLVPGEYYLVETKSPTGYYKLNAPVKIVIAEGKDADNKDIVKVTVTYKELTIDSDGVLEWKETKQELTGEIPSGINTVPVELEPIVFNIYDYPKYGKLKIEKYLSSYELDDTATFKFQVTGTIKEKDESGNIKEKEVYNQVVVLTLSKTNTGSTIIDMIPAGAHIVVDEIYTGSHYELDPNAIQETETTIIANETVSVRFTNRMKWDDIDGHGIVNIFEPDPNSSNGWKWTGEYYPSTPSALPPEPQTGGGTGGGDDGTGGSGGDSGGGSDGPAEGGGSQAAPAG